MPGKHRATNLALCHRMLITLEVLFIFLRQNTILYSPLPMLHNYLITPREKSKTREKN